METAQNAYDCHEGKWTPCSKNITMRPAQPPPAFIVFGEWSDPIPENRASPRSHPYGILAWIVQDGDQKLIFPNRSAADEYRDRVLALQEAGRHVRKVEIFHR
jgi:hypothetical protein